MPSSGHRHTYSNSVPSHSFGRFTCIFIGLRQLNWSVKRQGRVGRMQTANNIYLFYVDSINIVAKIAKYVISVQRNRMMKCCVRVSARLTTAHVDAWRQRRQSRYENGSSRNDAFNSLRTVRIRQCSTVLVKRNRISILNTENGSNHLRCGIVLNIYWLQTGQPLNSSAQQMMHELNIRQCQPERHGWFGSLTGVYSELLLLPESQLIPSNSRALCCAQRFVWKYQNW